MRYLPIRLLQAVSRAYEYAIDTVFPPDPFIRRIETMTAEEFSKEAPPVDPSEAVEGIVSFFSYRDELVKAAVLDIKSYANDKIASVLGKAVYQSLVFELSELEIFQNFKDPLLLPVPITKKVRRKRGWNQCEVICRSIHTADIGNMIEYRPDILVKCRETADQVGRSRAERFENLKGCFSVARPERIKGRNVIILDDIATTGATLQQAKRAVMKAGARRVLCVAVSH